MGSYRYRSLIEGLYYTFWKPYRSPIYPKLPTCSFSALPMVVRCRGHTECCASSVFWTCMPSYMQALNPKPQAWKARLLTLRAAQRRRSKGVRGPSRHGSNHAKSIRSGAGSHRSLKTSCCNSSGFLNVIIAYPTLYLYPIVTTKAPKPKTLNP